MRRIGKRDGRTAPLQGGFPAVVEIFRQVDIVAADIDGELQRVVRDIDYHIFEWLAKARIAREELDDLTSDASRLESRRSTTDPSSVSARNLERLIAKKTAAAAKQDDDADHALAQLPGLLADRERAHAAAVALFKSWIARANQLAALHSRGYMHGRSTTEADPQFVIPTYVVTDDYAWAHGRHLRLVDVRDPEGYHRTAPDEPPHS